MQPVISIIIPVYNGRKTIAACIEALLDQDYPQAQYEIIVVDNNSTDGTDEIVTHYPVNLFYERAIQTPAATRNRGIREAKGEILVFVDADCIASPSLLQNLVKPFELSTVGAVCGSIEAYQQETLVEQYFADRNPYTFQGDEGFVHLLTGNMACTKALIIQLGFFDEHLSTAEDLDLGWRIQIVAGKEIVYRPGAIVQHKYRSTIGGLFNQYRRYGFSEILVDTLYRGKQGCPRKPGQQILAMVKQIKAQIIYLLSFSRRSMPWLKYKYNRRERIWPLLHLTAETGNLVGKFEGLLATRFFSRHPFPTRSNIQR